jgi:hypothetical protein
MHLFGALELEIQPGTPDRAAGVKIALLRYTRARMDACLSRQSARPSKKIEGQINSLQDELDEIRECAQRAFQVT